MDPGFYGIYERLILIVLLVGYYLVQVTLIIVGVLRNVDVQNTFDDGMPESAISPVMAYGYQAKKRGLSLRLRLLTIPLCIVAVVVGMRLLFPTLPQPKWSLYTSPDGHYSVMLPGKPVVKVLNVRTIDGKHTVRHKAFINHGLLGVSYSIEFSELPMRMIDLPLQHPGREGIESELLNFYIKQSEIKPISKKAITIGSYSGIECQTNNILFGKETIRYIIANNRMYILRTGPEVNKYAAQEMAAFLDSFTIAE